MQYELIISNTIETIHISGMDIMCFKADGNYSHMILCEGEERIISWQLGQLEDLIYEQLGDDASLFVRIGRGIIVNREYIYVINLQKQELILRSHNGFKIEHNASKESLKQLKDHIEKYSIKKYGGHG